MTKRAALVTEVEGVRFLLEPSTTAGDLAFVVCEECGVLRGPLWPQPQPWGGAWTRWMHNHGTGHRVGLYRLLAAQRPADPDTREAAQAA